MTKHKFALPYALLFRFALPGVLALCALVSRAVAQPPELTRQLDAIFNQHSYRAKSVQLAWQNDGDSYTILEPAAAGKGMDIAAYETASGKRSVLVPASALIPPGAEGDKKVPLEIESYSWSQDRKKLLIFTNSKKVWRRNTRGDYWVYDTGAANAAGRLMKLGGDAPESTLMFAQFSPDGTRVAYVRANNLYVQELAGGRIARLTGDGSADIINGTSDWVNEEELALRDCFRWSPDGKSIAYWQFDQSEVGEYSLINDTQGEYPLVTRYKYPQPGTTNSAVRAGVVPAEGGPTRWLQLDGDPRNHYIAQLDWAGNSSTLMLQYLDRAQKHDRILLADAHTGQTRLLTEDSDTAWVDAMPIDLIKPAGVGSNSRSNGESSGESSAESNSDLIFTSERDGWRHAWRVDQATGKPRLITNFEADMTSEERVDESGGWLYFLASPGDPIRRYLYRSRLDGSGSPERVTPADEPGTHGYDIAPNGRFAVHYRSSVDQPGPVEIVSLPDHKPIRTLVDNSELAAKVRPLLSSQTEFFTVPVAGGVTLNGYILKPPDFDPAKKYPVLTNVYGEPAGTTVNDAWGGSTRLFHGLIAEQGYLVISFDNQGTPSPRGREWRKCVAGAIGVLSSAQQAQAIQELARERSYIDTARMAIWGWSGGGSGTLNAVFRYPGVYSTGIAVAPVADESHYDSIYQERYMGLPAENQKGYHDGSPINFAQGLAGHLLVVHGSGDDNVHFQGTELLINRLIELGKPFDFMDYPNRTHSISEGKGTSFHIYSLIARYLEEHVPPGGVPR